MTSRADHVIVGAGLLGLAAARALRQRGRDVVVLEQASVGHRAAGSAGSARVFRVGYEDPDWVRLAVRTLPLWQELADQAGEPLLYPTPQLTFGTGMPTARAAMARAGAPGEPLTAAQAAERFPAVTGPGPALFEPLSAVIAADRVLAALAAGVPRISEGVAVTGLADDGRQVTVRTTAGDLVARTVVVCAGPGTSGLLATAGVAVPSGPTLEQVAYLIPDGPPGPGLPIFICYDGQAPYGLPVPGHRLYKIGIHPSGPPAGPHWPGELSPDPELSRRLGDVALAFLPGLDPRPVAAERCVYDNSPDGDFIADRIGNVVIGSGTSGHGFKFGPLLGDWLANLATGGGAGTDLPGGRFRLRRFSR